MIKKITSMTLHTTPLGERVAIAYSEIDDSGTVVSQNKRAESVILDDSVLKAVELIRAFASGKIEE